MDLCRWSDVCFLNRFIIAFPPRTKHLLISWLQLLSSVILKPNKIKSVTVSTFSPSTWILTLGQALSYCCKHHLISSSKPPHNGTHFTSKAAEGIKRSQNWFQAIHPANISLNLLESGFQPRCIYRDFCSKLYKFRGKNICINFHRKIRNLLYP